MLKISTIDFSTNVSGAIVLTTCGHLPQHFPAFLVALSQLPRRQTLEHIRTGRRKQLLEPVKPTHQPKKGSMLSVDARPRPSLVIPARWPALTQNKAEAVAARGR